MKHAKDDGVILVIGFPRVDGMAKQGGTCKDQLGHGLNMSISYNMHSSMGDHFGVIPSKRAFSERIKFGAVAEVDILGTVIVEVVVLVS